MKIFSIATINCTRKKELKAKKVFIFLSQLRRKGFRPQNIDFSLDFHFCGSSLRPTYMQQKKYFFLRLNAITIIAFNRNPLRFIPARSSIYTASCFQFLNNRLKKTEREKSAIVYSKNVYKIYKAHQCAKCHSSRLRGISSSTSIFNAASSSKHIHVRYTKDKFDKVE